MPKSGLPVALRGTEYGARDMDSTPPTRNSSPSPHQTLRAAMGLRLKQCLAALKDSHHAVIAEVRGEGLMLGLKCNVPNTLLVQKLREDGMLVVPTGDNVVRLLPPLIIDEPEIELACHKLDVACAALTADATAPA